MKKNLLNFYQEKYNKKLIIIFFIFIFLMSIFFLSIFNSAYGNLTYPTESILIRIRMVDMFKTIISGWAIGLSNYCLQYITKNRFADNGVLGTYSFLQLCTMVSILICGSKFLQIDQEYSISLIYNSIGIFSGIIFYFVSKKTNFQSKKILIYGLFLNTLIFSLISLILNVVEISSDTLKENYNYYLTKNLGFISGYGSIDSLIIQTIIVFACSIIIFIKRNNLISLSVSQNKFSTLGLQYNKTKLYFLIIIALLTSSTYALSGYIAFLGLAINYIVNQIFKGFKVQFFMCIIVSITIMCICQLLSKVCSYYFVVHGKSLPLSAFYGIITFPLFGFALFKK